MSERHILIVDDELGICEVLAENFEQVGYKADVAHNGKEAFERLRGKRPDAIILDLFMPVMDGVTFLNQLRQEEAQSKNRSIPVVVITGCYPDSMIKQLPISSYAIKPVLFEDLLKKVDQSINKTYPS